MNTSRRGVCNKCKQTFMFSIGACNIPQNSTPNILDWWNGTSGLCYYCAPIPQEFKSQTGVLMWRNERKT